MIHVRNLYQLNYLLRKLTVILKVTQNCVCVPSINFFVSHFVNVAVDNWRIVNVVISLSC